MSHRFKSFVWIADDPSDLYRIRLDPDRGPQLFPDVRGKRLSSGNLHFHFATTAMGLEAGSVTLNLAETVVNDVADEVDVLEGGIVHSPIPPNPAESEDTRRLEGAFRQFESLMERVGVLAADTATTVRDLRAHLTRDEHGERHK